MPADQFDGAPTSSRTAGWPPMYETGPPPVEAGSTDGRVAETGTTVVGLRTDDAVVMAADRRASVGGGRFVAARRVRKVAAVHPTAATALSGAVGHVQQFTAALRAEASLYEARRGEPTSVSALATLASNLLRSGPLHVTPLLGGVDGDGPRVCSLDGAGGVLTDRYAAAGSGMQLAYGVLEREYDPDAAVGAATAVAARAVDAASERDTASGNGLTVCVVTADGVALREYDRPDAVGDGPDPARNGPEDSRGSEDSRQSENSRESEDPRKSEDSREADGSGEVV